MVWVWWVLGGWKNLRCRGGIGMGGGVGVNDGVSWEKEENRRGVVLDYW